MDRSLAEQEQSLRDLELDVPITDPRNEQIRAELEAIAASRLFLARSYRFRTGVGIGEP